MAKSKKRIRKSIESFDKLIKEHKEKIKKFSVGRPWLEDYWNKQIKEFEKQKKKEEKKLGG